MEPNRKPIRLANRNLAVKLNRKLNGTEMKAPRTCYLEPLNSPLIFGWVLKKKRVKTSKQSFRTLREGSATIAC